MFISNEKYGIILQMFTIEEVNMKKVYSANLFFLFLIVLQIVSVVTLGPIIRKSGIPIWSSVVITEFLLTFLPSVIYLIVTRQDIKDALNLKPMGITSIFIVVLIGVLIYPIAMFIGYVSQLFFHNYLADAFQVFANLPLWAGILMIAVTPAICEETAMRGAVLSGYSKVNRHKAAVMNGLFFGILHMNLQQFFYAFAIGIIFAYLVMITGSLFSSMICHFTCNGISYAISFYALKGAKHTQNIESLSTSVKTNMFITLLICAVVCLTLILLLMQALKSVNRRKNEEKGIRTVEALMQDIAIGDHVFGEKSERVINWPVFAIVTVYAVFVAVLQFGSKFRS